MIMVLFLGWKRENCHDETQMANLGKELSSEMKKVSYTRQNEYLVCICFIVSWETIYITEIYWSV